MISSLRVQRSLRGDELTAVTPPIRHSSSTPGRSPGVEVGNRHIVSRQLIEREHSERMYENSGFQFPAERTPRAGALNVPAMAAPGMWPGQALFQERQVGRSAEYIRYRCRTVNTNAGGTLADHLTRLQPVLLPIGHRECSRYIDRPVNANVAGTLVSSE